MDLTANKQICGISETSGEEELSARQSEKRSINGGFMRREKKTIGPKIGTPRFPPSLPPSLASLKFRDVNGRLI